jgi:hypothetical protein
VTGEIVGFRYALLYIGYQVDPDDGGKRALLKTVDWSERRVLLPEYRQVAPRHRLFISHSHFSAVENRAYLNLTQVSSHATALRKTHSRQKDTAHGSDARDCVIPGGPTG